MERKKSIPGSILCIIYGILIVVMLLNSMLSLHTFELQTGLVCLGTIVAVLLIGLCAEKVSHKINRKQRVQNIAAHKIWFFIEMVCMIGIVTLAFYCRVWTLWIEDNIVTQNLYYQAAAIQHNNHMIYSEHNLSIVYTYLLSICFSFFGNQPMVGIVLQIGLQCIAILLTFGIVRLLSGSFAAMVVTLLLSLSPTMIRMLLPLSPEMFLLCIYLLLFYIYAVIWKHNARGEYNTSSNRIILIVVGELTGFVIFMDSFALSLLLLAIVGLILSNPLNEKNHAGAILSKISFYVFGTVIGFAIMVIGKALLYGLPILQPITEYIMSLWQNTVFVLQPILPITDEKTVVIILVLAGTWVLRYRKADRDEAALYVVFLFSSLAAMLCLQNTLSYQIFVLIAWLILAVIGLQSVCIQYTKQEREQNISQMLPALEKIKASPEAVNPVQLIPNPLPLPKKHVKKLMDYAFIPEAGQMHYEIEELKENDDYDIQ
ncbi:MAG: hypothetical protein RRX92_09295 [Lachnospiraceae bacterium]